MKSTSKFIMFTFTLLALTASADAQSPREQLQQMVEQLQKTPSDNVLRERIIKLGMEIKPAPAIPEEAVRRMARGAAAFKSATSAADYQDAAKEFEQAVLAAPWFADAYFNLGVTQDKAGSYEAAQRSLKLGQLSAPDSKEIKALIYEVEYRHEKANSPEVRAASQRQKDEELARSLDGVRFDCPDFVGNRERKEYWLVINGGQLNGWIKMLQVDTDRARVDHVGEVLHVASVPIIGTLARKGGPNWEETYRISSDQVVRENERDGRAYSSITCRRH